MYVDVSDVCMCMCVYKYTSICVCMSAGIYVCTCVYIYMYMYSGSCSKQTSTRARCPSLFCGRAGCPGVNVTPRYKFRTRPLSGSDAVRCAGHGFDDVAGEGDFGLC